MYLLEIYRVIHLTAAEYNLFSAFHAIFFKVHHILGHKASLNKYRKTEIISVVLSEYNLIKLGISGKRNYITLNGKLIAMSTIFKKSEILNKVMKHLKVLAKQDQLDYKVNRWNEIIKIRVEINEI
jgi:hypothetical protein